jgi:DNA-binding CsgD family transcriptional regulator
VSTTVSEADLRHMLDVVSQEAERSPGAEMPERVLLGLADLIPCTRVSFFVLERITAATMTKQVHELRAFPPDTEEDDALYASAFWDCVACSQPTELSGMSVTTWRDFYSDREFARLQMAEYFQAMDFWHALLLCLPSPPGVWRRLALTRDKGDVPFSERDRLLLTLLRPHLTEIRDRVEAEEGNVPTLTPRQIELLRCVAAGKTNGQISRHLGVSEGTVRKHLENIYGKLDAHSRTEAVTLARVVLAS